MIARCWLGLLPALIAGCAHQSNGCPESCTVGATRCAASQQQVCTLGAGGCTGWSAPADCPRLQSCEQERCAPCGSPCQATDVRCSADGRGVQQCAVLPTGCVGWGARVACGGGESCSSARCAFDAAVQHTELVDAIPDYLQSDPAYGGFANGGLNHCAPVSVSNTLMWLDDNGFERLVDDGADRKRDQYALILALAGPQLMNTDPSIGTDPSSLASGLHRFLEARGQSYQRLEFQGFRDVAAAFATGKLAPELDWIKQGFHEGAAVWLNIGFYNYDRATDSYARDFGHWVTLVGFGSDGSREDPAYLIVHDPAARAGTSPASDHVRCERLTTGTLTGSFSGLPRSAAGFYKLGGGLHLPSSADSAVLDGAIVLVL